MEGLVSAITGAAAESIVALVGKRDLRGWCTSGLNWRKIGKEVVARVSTFEGWPSVNGVRKDATGDVSYVEGGIHRFEP